MSTVEAAKNWDFAVLGAGNQLEQDFIYGIAADESMRAMGAAGVGAGLGAVVGGLMGGVRGAAVGGILGTLILYVAQTLGIIPEDAWKQLVEWRINGRLQPEIKKMSEAAKEGKPLEQYREEVVRGRWREQTEAAFGPLTEKQQDRQDAVVSAVGKSNIATTLAFLNYEMSKLQAKSELTLEDKQRIAELKPQLVEWRGRANKEIAADQTADYMQEIAIIGSDKILGEHETAKLQKDFDVANAAVVRAQGAVDDMISQPWMYGQPAIQEAKNRVDSARTEAQTIAQSGARGVGTRNLYTKGGDVVPLPHAAGLRTSWKARLATAKSMEELKALPAEFMTGLDHAFMVRRGYTYSDRPGYVSRVWKRLWNPVDIGGAEALDPNVTSGRIAGPLTGLVSAVGGLFGPNVSAFVGELQTIFAGFDPDADHSMSSLVQQAVAAGNPDADEWLSTLVAGPASDPRRKPVDLAKQLYEGDTKHIPQQTQKTLTFANGDTYVGSMLGGKRHGPGTYTWPSGGLYVGEWDSGKKNGQGTMTWPDGNTYVGEWDSGKTNGQGLFTWKDGGKYVGEFKDGHRHGQGTRTWASGRTFKGTYKNGAFWNGRGYHKDGTTERIFVEGDSSGRRTKEQILRYDAVNPPAAVKPPVPVETPAAVKPPVPVETPAAVKPPVPVETPAAVKPPAPPEVLQETSVEKPDIGGELDLTSSQNEAARIAKVKALVEYTNNRDLHNQQRKEREGDDALRIAKDPAPLENAVDPEADAAVVPARLESGDRREPLTTREINELDVSGIQSEIAFRKKQQRAMIERNTKEEIARRPPAPPPEVPLETPVGKSDLGGELDLFPDRVWYADTGTPYPDENPQLSPTPLVDNDRRPEYDWDLFNQKEESMKSDISASAFLNMPWYTVQKLAAPAQQVPAQQAQQALSQQAQQVPAQQAQQALAPQDPTNKDKFDLAAAESASTAKIKEMEMEGQLIKTKAYASRAEADQKEREVTKSSVGTGQSTVGTGQSTVGTGQSTVGTGQSTVGMDQSTVGMDQSTVGMDQSTAGTEPTAMAGSMSMNQPQSQAMPEAQYQVSTV
jgi:hypothetical protein